MSLEETQAALFSVVAVYPCAGLLVFVVAQHMECACLLLADVISHSSFIRCNLLKICRFGRTCHLLTAAPGKKYSNVDILFEPKHVFLMFRVLFL